MIIMVLDESAMIERMDTITCPSSTRSGNTSSVIPVKQDKLADIANNIVPVCRSTGVSEK